MARAMGLNAVSTYVFWNRHEPVRGEFHFSGDNDLARFLRIAADERLAVILRPGPYVCAEWDLGGFPAWLLVDDQMALRTTDRRFMVPVRAWLKRLGHEVACLQRRHGGPVIAIQLENEYGAYGSDVGYLRALRTALIEAGFDASCMYTIDQPRDLGSGALAGAAVAVTFAPGDPSTPLEMAHSLRPGSPMLCGEYWAGWFDHWGEPHARLDEQTQVCDIRWMLSCGVSLNIYMFHGGTNFGFWNGANAFTPHSYQPTTTSYDYQAALDEAGRPTEKYFRFREVAVHERGALVPPIPPPPQTAIIAPFACRQCAPVDSALGSFVENSVPLPMEMLGQSFGYTLYRSIIGNAGTGILRIADVRDYAVVVVDGNVVAHLDRRLDQTQCEITVPRDCAQLDILVENGGRINYGAQLSFERKGITREVRWNGEPIEQWRMYPLPFDPPRISRWSSKAVRGPAFYRAALRIDSPGDSFLDVRDIGKGALWINGHNLGRIWNIGPQRSLYVPGVWLERGDNEIVVLDLFERNVFPKLRGTTDPLELTTVA